MLITDRSPPPSRRAIGLIVAASARTSTRWFRRIAFVAGGVVIAGALMFAGLWLFVWLAFAEEVHPEYLAELRADPMATYEDPALVLDSDRMIEAADTWKSFRSAEIRREYLVPASADPDAAVERMISAAESHGWRRDESEFLPRTTFSKPEWALSITIHDDEGIEYLTLTLRYP
jgi:hypothetical protein